MTGYRKLITPFLSTRILRDRRKCEFAEYEDSEKRKLTLSRSGELNAKNREILALQAQARARLAKTRANFAEGMKAAKDVQRDLDWTQKKVRYEDYLHMQFFQEEHHN